VRTVRSSVRSVRQLPWWKSAGIDPALLVEIEADAVVSY